jgi:hypothetical protein
MTKRDTPEQPWVSSPYSLISWWDMEKFAAVQFYLIGNFIGEIDRAMYSVGEANKVIQIFPDWLMPNGVPLKTKFNNEDKLWYQKIVNEILDSCEALGLRTSVICAQEFLYDLEHKELTVELLRGSLKELGNSIRREMQAEVFFHLPASRAKFYDNKELFGEQSVYKFPDLQDDIREAGNCLALGRGTACVFHLMRIMEAAVQTLERVS